VETAAILTALTDPAAYPAPPAAITTIQTHASVLFFAGDRVYKVKKSVDLGFLDFSTLERRGHFCREEVRLNAALAPGVYLGVAPITRDAAGHIRIRGGGETIEYAVEMVRLPADRLLDRIIGDDRVPPGMIDELVESLARFHAAAATGDGVNDYGETAAVTKKILGNLEQAAACTGEIPDEPAPDSPAISPALHTHLVRWSERFIAEHDDLLRARVAAGRIREGHGDVHAGNICLSGRGILIYDRIEFSPAFRCCDVAAEIAFLAMDFDARGRRDLAAQLVGAYGRATGDPVLAGLQPLYRSHFAAVRGKVASLRARDAAVEPAQRARAWTESAGYFNLAAGYTLPAALVMMCGLPGSGKSWAARAIADRLGARHLASDHIRKGLAGMPPTLRPSDGQKAGLYSRDMTDRTYAAMLAAAREQLRSGRTVVADANFPSQALRSPFLALARDLAVPLVLVHTDSRPETIRERMLARAADAAEASDADYGVYLAARARFEPPGEVPGASRVFIQSPSHEGVLVSRVVDRIISGVGAGL